MLHKNLKYLTLFAVILVSLTQSQCGQEPQPNTPPSVKTPSSNDSHSTKTEPNSTDVPNPIPTATDTNPPQTLPSRGESPTTTPSSDNQRTAQSDPLPLKVLFFGDSGTGDEKQWRAARGMEGFCSQNGCDFALMLGDNFYMRGVNSVEDEQFQTKFEQPYAGLKFPFHVVLGNHDTYSGPKGIQAQVEYSTRSTRWKFPELYYSFVRGNTEFFGLDTNSYLKDKNQQKWFKNAIQESKAQWKVVFAHHAIYSTGHHSQLDWKELYHQKRLRHALQPILCRHRAIYLAGHEHILQLNELPCGAVSVVSGAAASPADIIPETLKKQNNALKFYRGSELGFAWATFNKDAVTLIFLDEKGAPVYQYQHRG